MGSLISDRLPEAVKSDENDLLQLITNFVLDPRLLHTFKNKTGEFMKLYNRGDSFVEIIGETINVIKNKKFAQKI